MHIIHSGLKWYFLKSFNVLSSVKQQKSNRNPIHTCSYKYFKLSQPSRMAANRLPQGKNKFRFFLKRPNTFQIFATAVVFYHLKMMISVTFHQPSHYEKVRRSWFMKWKLAWQMAYTTTTTHYNNFQVIFFNFLRPSRNEEMSFITQSCG